MKVNVYIILCYIHIHQYYCSNNIIQYAWTASSVTLSCFNKQFAISDYYNWEWVYKAYPDDIRLASIKHIPSTYLPIYHKNHIIYKYHNSTTGNGTVSTITFHNITVAKAGDYVCYYFFGEGTAQCNIKLIVLTIPTVSHQLAPLINTSCTNLVSTCYMKGTLPAANIRMYVTAANVNITYSYTEYTNGTYVGYKQLYMDTPKETYNLLVICAVSHDHIPQKYRRPNVMPIYLTNVYIAITTVNLTVIRYADTTQITCYAFGNPPASYTWFYTNNTNSTAIIYATASAINVSSNSGVGLYTCNAYNVLSHNIAYVYIHDVPPTCVIVYSLLCSIILVLLICIVIILYKKHYKL